MRMTGDAPQVTQAFNEDEFNARRIALRDKRYNTQWFAMTSSDSPKFQGRWCIICGPFVYNLMAWVEGL